MLNIKYMSLSLAILLSSSAIADEVKMYSDKVPSAEEMGSSLFASEPGPAVGNNAPQGVKMRSISFGKPKNEPVAAPAAQVGAIGLPIKFAYNSADVLEESKPYLNEVGRMLNLPEYSDQRLVIEGHTDALGSESYNQYLSERRAASVKSYLKNNFNIAENRLFINGVGENQPLPGTDPNSGLNRRVQFRKAP